MNVFVQMKLTTIVFWSNKIMVPVTFSYFADCLYRPVQAEEEARRNRLMRDMAQLRLQVLDIIILSFPF